MNAFERRLSERRDELEWLYMELYNNRERLEALEARMREAYHQRGQGLKRLDSQREENPEWFRSGKMLGVTMYTNLFAGDLKHLEQKLDYLSEQGITYLHLMPLLKMPHPDNDGGYAVEDFNQVDPPLGTNEDLSHLTAAMRRRGMSLCLDFVINHTADTHEWAMRAKAGEQEYIDRYICFDTPDIPRQMEQTIPDVFPETAPGSFIYQEQMHKYVCSSFHHYQWDLNYRNPVVFNEMVGSMLLLANLGVEVLRIDAVPYLWKEIGTTCRNLPKVHTIMRMIRLIIETVCPGVILKGEVVMAPWELAPYFGTLEKPECHLLYNSSTMATQWSALASSDVRQLKRQLDDLHSLPSHCCFVNYLRCHDDIGWGLDYGFLKQFGMNEVSHKKYLNDFLTGAFPEAFGRGELYNSDPTSGDARLCGTTASLCGIEKAAYERNDEALAQAVRLDLMLHAYMLTQSGIPVIYSGDEIGQENDYTYHEEPDRWGDSRYLHRGRFRWDLEAKRSETGTVQEKLFNGIGKLEQIRKGSPVFHTDAQVHTIDTRDDAVLGIVRENAGQKLTALFNFSAYEKTVYLEEGTGYTDLISGKKTKGSEVHVEGYGACWLVE